MGFLILPILPVLLIWLSPALSSAAATLEFNVLGVGDSGVGIGREDILPDCLRAVADEQKASRNAVYDLMQRVDAADCAADVAAGDFTLYLDPRVAPSEMPQRVGAVNRVEQPDGCLLYTSDAADE